MKRSQDFSATSPSASSSPVSKRLKVSPRESHGISVPGHQDVLMATEDSEGGWTKVEKRKAKKVKKVEGKLDVCVSFSVCSRVGPSCIVVVNPTEVYVQQGRNSQKKASSWNRCKFDGDGSTRGVYIDCAQDIRELVLHLAADAPPPSWVRVEVRLDSTE